MTVKKIHRMWGRGSSPAMRATGWVIFHRAILLLAIIGSVLLIVRRRWEVWPILLIVLGITAVGAVLLGVPRRNVPLMPLVASLAAAGGAGVVSGLRLMLLGRLGRRSV
jgi:hypothetical protein